MGGTAQRGYMRAGGAGEHAHVSVAAVVTIVHKILTLDCSLVLLVIALVPIIHWEEVFLFFLWKRSRE